jgi:hypothetical protein
LVGGGVNCAAYNSATDRGNNRVAERVLRIGRL